MRKIKIILSGTVKLRVFSKVQYNETNILIVYLQIFNRCNNFFLLPSAARKSNLILPRCNFDMIEYSVILTPSLCLFAFFHFPKKPGRKRLRHCIWGSRFAQRKFAKSWSILWRYYLALQNMQVLGIFDFSFSTSQFVFWSLKKFVSFTTLCMLYAYRQESWKNTVKAIKQ